MLCWYDIDIDNTLPGFNTAERVGRVPRTKFIALLPTLVLLSKQSLASTPVNWGLLLGTWRELFTRNGRARSSQGAWRPCKQWSVRFQEQHSHFGVYFLQTRTFFYIITMQWKNQGVLSYTLLSLNAQTIPILLTVPKVSRITHCLSCPVPSVPPFGSLFPMIRLRWCIFDRTATEVTLCSVCLLLGGAWFQFALLQPMWSPSTWLR